MRLPPGKPLLWQAATRTWAAWRRRRSADPERKSRLHLHDAALRDGPLCREQRLRRHEKALGVVYGAGRAGKLGDHGREHRLLAEVGLELARATARVTAAEDEPAKADDLRRAPAAESAAGARLRSSAFA